MAAFWIVNKKAAIRSMFISFIFEISIKALKEEPQAGSFFGKK
jgi:hypothetical protein